MTRRRQIMMKRIQPQNKTESLRLNAQLGLGVLVALFIAILVGTMHLWMGYFEAPPEQTVKIYRVHGCVCAFTWAEQLKAAGFAVQIRELTRLKDIRSTLHVPAYLKGCHVGNYLGYFVEGHVAPPALFKLAREHPLATGVVTMASANSELRLTDDGLSPVLVMATDMTLRPWFSPSS